MIKKLLCAVFSVGMFSMVCFGSAPEAAASVDAEVTTDGVTVPGDNDPEPLTCGRACILAGGACCGGVWCC